MLDQFSALVLGLVAIMGGSLGSAGNARLLLVMSGLKKSRSSSSVAGVPTAMNTAATFASPSGKSVVNLSRLPRWELLLPSR